MRMKSTMMLVIFVSVMTAETFGQEKQAFRVPALTRENFFGAKYIPRPANHFGLNWTKGPIPTQPGMHFTFKVLGSNKAYRASQWALLTSAVYDGGMTGWKKNKYPPVKIFFTQPLPPDESLAANQYILQQAATDWENLLKKEGWANEGGWARIVGQNKLAEFAFGAGFDVGVALIAHKLSKRGPKGKALGTGLNFWESANHIRGANSWLGINPCQGYNRMAGFTSPTGQFVQIPMGCSPR